MEGARDESRIEEEGCGFDLHLFQNRRLDRNPVGIELHHIGVREILAQKLDHVSHLEIGF